MKTFVINLKASADRRQFMRTQLEGLGLEHEFFNAVDGRAMTQADFEEKCDMQKMKEWPQLFTPGMIGCILSHYLVYKEIIRQNLPYALILEDDAKLSPALPGILNTVENLYNAGRLLQGEPVLLYYRRNKAVEFSTRRQLPINSTYSIYYPVNVWDPITTAAYVITKTAAVRLVENIYPVKYTPDSWGLFHRDGFIDSLRCVLPNPIESGFFRSDIGYELNRPLNRLVRFLDNRGIFPVKQLLRWRRQQLHLKQNEYVLCDKEIDWSVRSGPELTTTK